MADLLAWIARPALDRRRRIARIEELDRTSTATLARADHALEQARIAAALRSTVRVVRRPR